MNDTVLFLVVITGAFVVVFGIAYTMDRRRKVTTKAEAKVPPGPISQIVRLISYFILAMTVLLLIGSFVFNKMIFANLAGNFIFLYIIVGIVYRIVKPRGL